MSRLGHHRGGTRTMPKVLMKGNEAIGLAAVLGRLRRLLRLSDHAAERSTRVSLRSTCSNTAKSSCKPNREVAAINMVYGAAGAGKRVMTSSSSPGIALKQEGISYIAGAELPCVIVLGHARRSRSGRHPALAKPTITKPPAAAATATTTSSSSRRKRSRKRSTSMKEAFDVADYYRNPVMVLVDGLLGQMMESVDFNRPVNKRFLPPKDWATTGTRNHHSGRNIVYSSEHRSRTNSRQHNLKLQKKYQAVDQERDQLRARRLGRSRIRHRRLRHDGAHRPLGDRRSCKEEGVKVGMLRPISLWPFPKEAFENDPGFGQGHPYLRNEPRPDARRRPHREQRQHSRSASSAAPAGSIPEPEEVVETPSSILTKRW
ncbi:MAG: hypothetical protein MZU97_04905 [Bacillus subtilis]|nr:hypothetical protein [Bacillus subtilis]